MKIKDFIFFPAVENLRQWWLNQKVERERKRILRIRQMKVRTQPYSREENRKEMEKFMLSSSFLDSNGVKQKTVKLGRSVQSYYEE